jgi:hypothetical protein
MQPLTRQGKQVIEDLALRYGVSADAVTTMLQAVVNGNGTMAQFNHPEFGGGGQWMQGGMTMVGDMFNYALKAKVEGLCAELSSLLRTQSVFAAPASSQSQSQGGGYSDVSLFVPASAGTSGNWWPADLGVPAATGTQNNIRYAYFPTTRRLAVEIGGHVTLYDTQDHQIGGVAQQQGLDASLTFTSQYGLVRVANLPVVSIDRAAAEAPSQKEPERSRHPAPGVTDETVAKEDIFAKIERLAELKEKNILSEEEFATKKAELLSKI